MSRVRTKVGVYGSEREREEVFTVLKLRRSPLGVGVSCHQPISYGSKLYTSKEDFPTTVRPFMALILLRSFYEWRPRFKFLHGFGFSVLYITKLRYTSIYYSVVRIFITLLGETWGLNHMSNKIQLL